MQVRHGRHLWLVDEDQAGLDARIERMPTYHRQPDELLPPWAVQFYRDLQRELLAEPSHP